MHQIYIALCLRGTDLSASFIANRSSALARLYRRRPPSMSRFASSSAIPGLRAPDCEFRHLRIPIRSGSLIRAANNFRRETFIRARGYVILHACCANVINVFCAGGARPGVNERNLAQVKRENIHFQFYYCRRGISGDNNRWKKLAKYAISYIGSLDKKGLRKRIITFCSFPTSYAAAVSVVHYVKIAISPSFFFYYFSLIFFTIMTRDTLEIKIKKKLQKIIAVSSAMRARN